MRVVRELSEKEKQGVEAAQRIEEENAGQLIPIRKKGAVVLELLDSNAMRGWELYQASKSYM